MKRSYIFAITLVLLVGIQLYQPTSAQAPTNVTNIDASNESENASIATTDAASQLENATSALTNITKSLHENFSSIAPTKVNTATIVNSIFNSDLPALFIIVIFLVIIIPLVFDMYIAYRRRPSEDTRKEGGRRILGMPGLYRSLMCFGVILLVGTVIFYLLALITLNINTPNPSVLQSLVDLLKNLGTILGTALATIIAFYFGVRGAESAAEKTSTFVQEKEPPSIVSTDPVHGATGVKLDSLVQARFSESMNIQTINKDTFTVKKQAEPNPVNGKISYSPDNKTAMFDAEEDFSPNTVYVATIDIAAQDLAGDKLVSGKQWSFTTEPSSPAPAPDDDDGE